MPRVIATHGVENMETWLAGGAERAEIFKQFSSGYHIYRHQKDNKVAIVWENADLPKLEAVLAHPEANQLIRGGQTSLSELARIIDQCLPRFLMAFEADEYPGFKARIAVARRDPVLRPFSPD